MTSKQVVWLGIAEICVSCFATLLTLYVLCEAGYVWLAMVIFAPLSYGMARWPLVLVAKLKPDWFKKEWLAMRDVKRG